jgi:hypothetical protein
MQIRIRRGQLGEKGVGKRKDEFDEENSAQLMYYQWRYEIKTAG